MDFNSENATTMLTGWKRSGECIVKKNTQIFFQSQALTFQQVLPIFFLQKAKNEHAVADVRLADAAK